MAATRLTGVALLWQVEVAGVALVGGQTWMGAARRVALAEGGTGAASAETLTGEISLEERPGVAKVGEWTVVAAVEQCCRQASAATECWVMCLDLQHILSG